MELTELESRITHKRIGRPEVPAATDFKGSRYGGSGTFRAGTCRCYPKSGHVQSNSACLLSAPPHMRPPKSVQHLIGSNLHFSLTKLAAMSALGQKADIRSAKRHVRFTPESGHCSHELACPLSAKRTKKAAMRRPFSLGVNRLH